MVLLGLVAHAGMVLLLFFGLLFGLVSLVVGWVAVDLVVV